VSGRRPWSGLLRRVLERAPDEIDRRAARFAIGRPEGRRLVARLGEAFIGGYNATLRLESLRQVAEQGAAVDPHFRPFFFEGAAMGYLPRGYLFSGFTPKSAERDLLEMHPDFRYLYYVGLGFWLAMRHPRRPLAIERLGEHLNPMYVPLCYDGFGFKVGFFDYPGRPEARRLLDRCPAERRAAIYQGFGRALFFVHMDDEAAFRRERDAAGGEHREDMELGRSLALAFTSVDRPEIIAAHVAAAPDEADLRARLTGVTWALTARAMNDAIYFRRCVESAPAEWSDLMPRLPALCRKALSESRTYAEWQSRTRTAVSDAYAASRAPAGR
jgi:hypothetical protein